MAKTSKFKTNRSIPECTVIPELEYEDVKVASSWLCKAFGFTMRVSMGGHRAQLNVGENGAVVVMERASNHRKAAAQSVLVRVENADAHCAHAGKCGAKIVRPAMDYPYGERQYTVEDFAGNRWTFSQTIADVAPEAWGGKTKKN